MYTLPESAALTSRHPEVIRRWCAAGILPGVIRAADGRSYLLTPEAIDAIRARRRWRHARPVPPT